MTFQVVLPILKLLSFTAADEISKEILSAMQPYV